MKFNLKLKSVCLCLGICLYACTPSPPASTTAPQPQSRLASPAKVLPEVLAYQKSLHDNTLPALPLTLSGDAAAAQQLALAHPSLAAQLQMQRTKLRAEVMAVYPLRVSDLNADVESCRNNHYYRVEVYDFARNTTLTGIADLTLGKILSWRADAGRQAEVPERLKNLAIALAISASEVKESLGGVVPKFNAINSSAGRNSHLVMTCDCSIACDTAPFNSPQRTFT